MAALPKFSFSGWTSQSLAPKVNPATVPIAAPTATPGAPQLVAQTNAANTNLPAWLQDEVAKLNAAQALRTQMAGQVTGQSAAPAYDPNLGIAAVTAARSQYNTSLNQINEQARLQNLIQQRSQIGSANAFGFNSPFDVERQTDLDRQIAGYRTVNLPLASSAVSGWVGGGGGRRGSVWANGMLNGTGYA